MISLTENGYRTRRILDLAKNQVTGSEQVILMSAFGPKRTWPAWRLLTKYSTARPIYFSRLQFLGTCRSRTNADDCLPRAALGRVEGGDGLVEGRDVADVRPQSSVTHTLDDLTQLGTIGLDNEVDRQAVGGPRLGRPDDGHQRSSGSNQGC